MQPSEAALAFPTTTRPDPPAFGLGLGPSSTLRDMPSIGESLAGRYRLDALIGSGGFATVFSARDMRLERDVAVKVVSQPRDRPGHRRPVRAGSKGARRGRPPERGRHPRRFPGRPVDRRRAVPGHGPVRGRLPGGPPDRIGKWGCPAGRAGPNPRRCRDGPRRAARPRDRPPGSQAVEHPPVRRSGTDRGPRDRGCRPERADCRRDDHRDAGLSRAGAARGRAGEPRQRRACSWGRSIPRPDRHARPPGRQPRGGRRGRQPAGEPRFRRAARPRDSVRCRGRLGASRSTHPGDPRRLPSGRCSPRRSSAGGPGRAPWCRCGARRRRRWETMRPRSSMRRSRGDADPTVQPEATARREPRITGLVGALVVALCVGLAALLVLGFGGSGGREPPSVAAGAGASASGSAGLPPTAGPPSASAASPAITPTPAAAAYGDARAASDGMRTAIKDSRGAGGLNGHEPKDLEDRVARFDVALEGATLTPRAPRLGRLPRRLPSSSTREPLTTRPAPRWRRPRTAWSRPRTPFRTDAPRLEFRRRRRAICALP